MKWYTAWCLASEEWQWHVRVMPDEDSAIALETTMGELCYPGVAVHFCTRNGQLSDTATRIIGKAKDQGRYYED